MLFTGLINLAAPSYGVECLRLMSSVYPGFHFSRTFRDVLVGTGYGLVEVRLPVFCSVGCTISLPGEKAERNWRTGIRLVVFGQNATSSLL